MNQFWLAPRDLVVLKASIRQQPPALLNEELDLIKDVSPLRKRRIATGRWLSRQAMQRFGHNRDTAILADFDGKPIWPSELTGSISHSDDQCVVVVGSKNTASSVGVDIETNGNNFARNDWRLVVNEAENRELPSRTGLSAHECVNLLFSAKEAVYKCVSQVAFIEFDLRKIVCSIRADNRGFTAHFSLPDLPPNFPYVVPVDWTIAGDFILTLAWIPKNSV